MVGLRYCPIEWQWTEIEVIDQALHYGLSTVALQFNIAYVLAAGRRPEVAVDTACTSFRGIPAGKSFIRDPNSTLGNVSLHIGEVIKVIGIPYVQITGCSSFLTH